MSSTPDKANHGGMNPLTKRGSPLRVRKTRENLRQGDQHDNQQGAQKDKQEGNRQGDRRDTQQDIVDAPTHVKSGLPRGQERLQKPWNEGLCHFANALYEDVAHKDMSQLDLQHEIRQVSSFGSDCLGQSSRACGDVSPPHETLKQTPRRRSVRKRVVSRVKEGILSRSRSANKMLIRTPSGLPANQSDSTHSGTDLETWVHKPRVSASALLAEAHASQCSDDLDPAELILCKSSASEATPSASIVRSASAEDCGTPQFIDITSSSHETPYRVTGRPTNSANEFFGVVPGVLQLRQSNTASVDAVDVGESRSFWVLVEVEATIPPIVNVSDDPANKHGLNRRTLLQSQNRSSTPLDMVIVIDNSLWAPKQQVAVTKVLIVFSPLTSMRALQCMKAVVQRVAEALEVQEDRLAVFITHCRDPARCHYDMTASYTLHSLRRPNLSDLLRELDQLQPLPITESSLPVHQPARLWEEMATYLTRPTLNQGLAPIPTTDVAVLSPNPKILAGILHARNYRSIHQFRCGLF